MLHYKNARSIYNPTLDSLVSNTIIRCANSNTLNDENIHYQFVKEYFNWIKTTTLNKINGLDNFPILTYSNGTTEAFDKFYIKNHSRRFRFFKGEYLYHKLSRYLDWKFIEDDSIKTFDAVIISLPFSDTGSKHPLMQLVLDQCNNLNVPVLVDCAYFGLCANIDFNFENPCITDVTFSLSKSLPISNLRIGLRLTRQDDDDLLLVTHKSSCVNRLSAGVGLRLINHFDPDYNFKLYRETQEQFCSKLDLTPSDTVIFGIDVKNKYNQYNRGYISNRLCFSNYFYDQNLPNEI